MIEERVPKYFQLKKAIIRKIEEEEYLPGGLIPSERELMEQYQVSRITVRKAIDELVVEGYLYKIQGKGTYVKTDEKGNDLFSLVSCTQAVRNMGMTPTKQVIMANILTADKKRAKALNLSDTDQVFQLGRVLYANGEPLNYTLTYLPLKLFPRLEEHDFGKESLYMVLSEEYHVNITKARRTVEAVLVKDEIAEYLDIEAKMPVILFGCTTYGEVNGQEIPIENFKCYYRTDKYKFYIDQVAQ
ncbi:GntR family transcriptional regulator [Muricomes intestini]|uniref:GntR family transcriptional regulator n=1 Tax=Muricomes intestini TaxID=1796634 RepID=A0A4R3KH45_9FIRM|nr:GntR family transcriptional regulator [Muricomes intestini]TCS82349.1 GntR family transcriptional regulator [Muricomes intestini]